MARLICGEKGSALFCDSGKTIVKEHGEKKKRTNADRIRSMSDEELLDFICSIETYDDGSVKIIEDGYALCSVTDVENWLKSKA